MKKLDIKSVEILNDLKIVICVRTNRELSVWLEVQPNTISTWRVNGIPPKVRKLIELVLYLQ